MHSGDFKQLETIAGMRAPNRRSRGVENHIAIEKHRFRGLRGNHQRIGIGVTNF